MQAGSSPWLLAIGHWPKPITNSQQPTANSRTMNRLLTQLIKLLSAAVIVTTFLAYLSPFVNPAYFRWFSFFGTAFPWLMLANMLLMLVWAFRLHRFALYHLGMLLFGWQHVTGFIGLNFNPDLAPDNAITITTHNLGGFFRGVGMTKAEWDEVFVDYVQFLKDNGNPDILCTQETGRRRHPSLTKKMGFPYTFHLAKGGNVILSRYPIIRGGQVPFGQPENSSIWVDIQIGKQTIRVYNVHLQSNKVTHDTNRVLNDSDLQKKQTWRDINKVLRKVGGATMVRAGQADILRDLIAASPHPVILCGDFNDTPNSYVYRRLAENMHDTFRETGLGLGTTFSGAVPLLRIDYILADPKMKAYSCKVLRRSASDHYAVVAKVGF